MHEQEPEQELEARLRSLPAPPVVMALIIEEVGKPSVQMHRLSSLIESEPTFTARLLRIANSAGGARVGVKTIRQATVTLGARTIRNEAVSHVVRVTSNQLPPGDLDVGRFWEDSLRRGTAARIIAEALAFEDPTEAFTVGLIQDLGTLMLAAVFPEKSQGIEEATRLAAGERIAFEMKRFGTTHAAFFSKIGATWSLPADLCEAVNCHHDPSLIRGNRRLRRICQIAYAADAVADVFQARASAGTLEAAKAALARLSSNRRTLVLDEICDALRVAYPETARSLSIVVGEQPTLGDLITSVNASLLEITAQYEDTTQRLEMALREKEDLMRLLERKNDELARLAATDSLTGLANRRRFTEALHATLEDASERGESVSVVMIDLDHFKKVNDTYGHQCGDEVLAEAARRFALGFRASDFIGRIGGEEFAVILPATDRAGAELAANRCRNFIAASPIACKDGSSVAITASFGGTTWDPCDPDTSVSEMLSRADARLYTSKKTGRNKVTWDVVALAAK